MSNSYQFDNAPAIIKDYLIYMQTIKGKSLKTIDEYYSDLRTFFRFIKVSRGLVSKDTPYTEINISDIDIHIIKSVTLTDIYEFMNYVMRERNNNNSTRARKSSSLRGFFGYITTKKHLLENDPTKELIDKILTVTKTNNGKKAKIPSKNIKIQLKKGAHIPNPFKNSISVSSNSYIHSIYITI